MLTPALRRPALRPVALAAAAALGAACSATSGDPTGPDDAGRPAVTLSGPASATAAMQGGKMQCPYTLGLAVAGGEAGAQVTLLGAHVEWRKPGTAELLTPSSKADLTAADLTTRWFKATRFTTGDTRAVNAVAGTSPHQAFDMVHALRYRADGGGERTTTYTLACR